ncbi:MAG: cell wall hydrolase [Clostridia bacterium]|nr:cell wall hydrolase [Clostridia bacterium]
MKKILMALAAWLVFSASAAAQEVPVDIRVNGEYIKTVSEPIVLNGRTYAPIRSVANALCSESVIWNDAEKSADITIGGNTLKIYIGSTSAVYNGKTIPLSEAPFISSDRTFLPVRAISELFGANVSWDSEYKNVEITKEEISVPESSVDTSFTHDDLYWMSRIIKAESCGEPLFGKIAVGDVILNRVKSNLFPNTIYGVIFDTKYSVQFEPVMNGSIYNQPCEESIAAAKLSMTNDTVIGNCLYFFNPSIAASSWISKNRIYYTTIGKHQFYL